MAERTLIFVKPDGVRRGLVGEIISRFERKGLRIVAMKMLRFTRELARKHYEEHVNKPFYPALEEFVLSGPVVAMVLEGENVVEVTRKMMGATRYTEAAPGTIRGDFAFSVTENLVHGSDSPARAEVEIANFFRPDELVG
ncbi:MAG: nucleoside-diphosphate kinase [Candidatus Hydrogenedentota bacterium]|uniref:Nucleoside diphosphate kinase n=1 Tax=Sumerlaea chitinivorans TaxID=2250252 RepID=A0A2Z4Y6Q9_SUMC1|nr:Nucleoside diphosphate kinase [Candidatus Sumerlaea chitinivorans]MCX7963145.1 nucleoside-diphosphate kinase [Candidatus Sumerlaea chitinivorans]RMH26600.1 MAG: nucleoside-diphosphate kinase [Candidatus Hydrogenedentota bacterium]